MIPEISDQASLVLAAPIVTLSCQIGEFGRHRVGGAQELKLQGECTIGLAAYLCDERDTLYRVCCFPQRLYEAPDMCVKRIGIHDLSQDSALRAKHSCDGLRGDLGPLCDSLQRRACIAGAGKERTCGCDNALASLLGLTPAHRRMILSSGRRVCPTLVVVVWHAPSPTVTASVTLPRNSFVYILSNS